MILTNLSYVSRDNFWGKICFLVFFSLVSSYFQRICLEFWKKYNNGWKHFLPRVRRTFGEKFFHQNFFSKKFFGLWEKSFQTFDVLSIGRAFKIAFFCRRNFVTRNNFFRVNEITIKNFWPPTVSCLDFWRKKLAGILEFNYSCPDELSEKIHLFHKISYFHESFRTLGEKCSKLCATLFGRAIEKATFVSRGTLWRKTKCFKCFRERCFLKNTYGLWSEKFAPSGKNNSLGSKNSILCVQGNVTFSEKNKIFVSKSSFSFVKSDRALRQNISDFWESCLRQDCHLSVLLLPGKVSGKSFSKKVFLHCFQTWSKKSTIERTSGWMWKLYSTCPVEFSLGKTFFLKVFDIFFHVFRAKNCKVWKNFRRILKIAFYTSKGTSSWTYFGPLKTYFH